MKTPIPAPKSCPASPSFLRFVERGVLPRRHWVRRCGLWSVAKIGFDAERGTPPVAIRNANVCQPDEEQATSGVSFGAERGSRFCGLRFCGLRFCGLRREL